MSINFATLQGLTIPEGVVTQIADASGRILWSAVKKKPVILEVAKQSITSKAGETTYTDETILLDIYPEKFGTVKVTYGGITKSITDTSGEDEPNAQQVFFGAFQGENDAVEIPVNGTLTIEGRYRNFGVGSFTSTSTKTTVGYCNCITAVTDFGEIDYIASHAFDGCAALVSINLPNTVQNIGGYAFYNCTALASIGLPNVLQSIGSYAFYKCSALVSISIPTGVTSIESYTFYQCTSLSNVILPVGITVIGTYAFTGCTALASIGLPNGLDRLERYAFDGCTILDHIHIPASVTFLGIYSLDCWENSLGFNEGDYYMHSKVPPVCEMEALSEGYDEDGPFGSKKHSVSIDIWVPVGCAETYKAADGWKYWASRIQEREGL